MCIVARIKKEAIKLRWRITGTEKKVIRKDPLRRRFTRFLKDEKELGWQRLKERVLLAAGRSLACFWD